MTLSSLGVFPVAPPGTARWGRGRGALMLDAMSRLARCSVEPDPGALRLLMIDDSPKVLAVLRCLLSEQPGLVVVGTASSAEPGLEVARMLRPDVVLLDVRMPGMGGLAAVPLF